METAEASYNQVLAAAGCDDLDCLVAADAETVSRAGDIPAACREGCAWAPVVDGVELVDFPIGLLASGRFKQGVALLQSTTADDSAGFLDEVRF